MIDPLACMFCFPNVGHLIVSFKFRPILVHM